MIRPFEEWVTNANILDEPTNSKRAAPIENQARAFNEWGNIEPSQALINDVMLDDGWQSQEVALQQLSDAGQNEEAQRSVFSEY